MAPAIRLVFGGERVHALYTKRERETWPYSPDIVHLRHRIGSRQLLYRSNTTTQHCQTEWADGLCQQSGFTTTFQPNTVIPYAVAGKQYDIDFVSWREGTSLTQPSHAALPSRSYHVGLVQCGLMDGSVRPVNSSIDLVTWRSLGTRSGGEVVGEH